MNPRQERLQTVKLHGMAVFCVQLETTDASRFSFEERFDMLVDQLWLWNARSESHQPHPEPLPSRLAAGQRAFEDNRTRTASQRGTSSLRYNCSGPKKRRAVEEQYMTSANAAQSEDLRYPVGRFQTPQNVTHADYRVWIAELEALPQNLKKSVSGLTDSRLDSAYRPGGWTIRQVVHHLADSHMNSYVRFRLALTEDTPTIKPYNEAAWAELPDAKTARIEPSMHLLEGLHARWVLLLQSFKSADMARTFNHPERGPMSLETALSLYAWHCRHHIAQITNLRQREGW